MKLLDVEKPEWRHEDEILYSDAVDCMKKLGSKYKIGVIANHKERGMRTIWIKRGFERYWNITHEEDYESTISSTCNPLQSC